MRSAALSLLLLFAGVVAAAPAPRTPPDPMLGRVFLFGPPTTNGRWPMIVHKIEGGRYWVKHRDFNVTPFHGPLTLEELTAEIELSEPPPPGPGVQTYFSFAG